MTNNSITYCTVDCSKCELKDTCGGCVATYGQPFGGECIIAKCCRSKGYEYCKNCSDSSCGLKKQLIAEFNALGIEDMDEVTNLNALKGSFINLEYTLPSGQLIKFWDDNRIYLGNQIRKKNSDRCYGLTADENYILVCEYGDGGSDAEIVVYKKRKVIHMIESRCGLLCSECDFREKCNCGGCIETNGHPFHGECPVAKCCQDKGFTHCGECPNIPEACGVSDCKKVDETGFHLCYSCDKTPCGKLHAYSYTDPIHGDHPPGARVEQCKKWAKEKGK